MTSRDRRTLTVGVSVIAGLFATTRAAPALRAWTNGRQAESIRASQLLAASSIDPRELSAARDTLAARTARLAALDSLVPRAGSASAAVAKLASTLEDLADSCSVRVAAIQLRPDSTLAGGFTEVSARLNGTADVTGLAALLRAIAESSAPLVVRELAVTATEPSAPTSKPEALRFDVLVAGLARTVVRDRP
jgi:Type II secretion system (T2SS), protein M subtype b